VPTHCSPMPMLCFGFRPCRASLHHCLAEHNFAIAALCRASLCFGYVVHVCAATELCFAFALRSVELLCPRDSKLLCAVARQWTAFHRRSAACHLSVLPCPRCAIP
jgi:hypothetical protein